MVSLLVNEEFKNDSEGSGRSVLEILTCHMLLGDEENHENLQSG
jgi:hypothetical protein